MLIESNIQTFDKNTTKQSKPYGKMLCRQVSIESPAGSNRDFVFNCEVPVPDVPPNGARIRVVCAGACYRMRNRSSSTSSVSSAQSTEENEYYPNTISYYGIRDGALFAGYEISGIIDALGCNVQPTDKINVDKRVILYPYDGIPHGYAEYIVVPSVEYLIPIPDNLSMGVAAMLPSGALLAKNAVFTAHKYAVDILENRPIEQICRILIVGTGGLALWALRIAEHHFKTPEYENRVQITVACLKDEGYMLANELPNVTFVQWNEEVYEKQLIDRTKNACGGLVDIVIDFGTTSRSLHRSLSCLNERGIVLISEEVAERLLPKFSTLINKTNKKIEAVSNGTIEQLTELVEHVASGEITPPPHTEFAPEEAATVVQKLCRSEIPGRAILRFHDIQ